MKKYKLIFNNFIYYFVWSIILIFIGISILGTIFYYLDTNNFSDVISIGSCFVFDFFLVSYCLKQVVYYFKLYKESNNYEN